MTLRLYNTLTRTKEEFRPMQDGAVGMYVCGPTVYGPCHIGHARCYVVFDVLYRYLRHTGYHVTYVRNYTDVDDKIIARAHDEGRAADDVAREYAQMFDDDMDALGLKHPEVTPRVTDHIADIVNLISDLVEEGYAYEAGGDVFFSVKKDTEYGKLANRLPEDLEAGVRVDINEAKNDPLDFALWKAAKPGEPSWSSPWGEGRPGWHIECSAMSQKYLGATFDIHGGGNDLIFPHHENEIAQSECASHAPFARYWVHNGHVNINAEKMSKSLGNIINIRDSLAEYPAEALKFFLLSVHYRSPLDYTKDELDQATEKYLSFYRTLQKLDDILGDRDDAGDDMHKPAGELSGCASELRAFTETFSRQFADAMDDDLNTAKALGHFHLAFRHINRCLDADSVSDKERIVLRWARHTVLSLGTVLGLFATEPAVFIDQYTALKAQKLALSPDDIERLIAERTQARADKNFARADDIRDDLKAHGVILEDGPQGTTWRLET